MLGVRVHIDLPPELLPDDYVLLTIDLHDLPIVEVNDLPTDPATCGDAWLREQRSAVLQLPSLIVPESAATAWSNVNRAANQPPGDPGRAPQSPKGQPTPHWRTGMR